MKEASKIITTPPSGMEIQEWWDAIAPQLFALLDGQGDLDMVKVASFIIGFGILGRKEYGAPGTLGWRYFAEPILRNIDPMRTSERERYVEWDRERPLVSGRDVADALRRLASLLSSHPNPGLSRRLLNPIVLPLWALASWPATGNQFEDYRAPATFLLQTLLQLSTNAMALAKIADNLLFTGEKDSSFVPWEYVARKDEIAVEWPEKKISFSIHEELSIDQELMDHKVGTFMNILKLIGEGTIVSQLFLRLFKRYLVEDEKKSSEILLEAPRERSIQEKILDAKLLQSMIDTVPDRLVDESLQVLEMAKDVLQSAANNDDVDGDETVTVALSLINLVFTSPSFKASSYSSSLLTSLHEILDRISKTDSESASTAQNLMLLLDYRSTETSDDPSSKPAIPDQIFEDRKTLKIAMDYITSPDSPPPVRAQGLDLLTDLIKRKSTVIDVPGTLILLTRLLQDEEEYIYLHSIISLIALSSSNPRSVMNDLLERYFDKDEELSLDARLRLAEALGQVIEKAGEAFSGPGAKHVGEGLLALAGRRGFRPKTHQEHERQRRKAERERRRRNKEAEEAWEGEVPSLSDDEEEMSKEDQEILNQIVTGWEGKRDEEDVRVRASALSIFATAIETNILGLGGPLVAGGVDLSINILPLEPEPEKAILRRSAILLVLSMIRALDRARDAGRNLGFGFEGKSLEDVERVFRYVEGSDNDGLVRQHARDVLEELENWKGKGLLGAAAGASPGGILGEGASLEESGLRGLSVNPLRQGSGRAKGGMPKIEEIE